MIYPRIERTARPNSCQALVRYNSGKDAAPLLDLGRTRTHSRFAWVPPISSDLPRLTEPNEFPL